MQFKFRFVLRKYLKQSDSERAKHLNSVEYSTPIGGAHKLKNYLIILNRQNPYDTALGFQGGTHENQVCIGSCFCAVCRTPANVPVYVMKPRHVLVLMSILLPMNVLFFFESIGTPSYTNLPQVADTVGDTADDEMRAFWTELEKTKEGANMWMSTWGEPSSPFKRQC